MNWFWVTVKNTQGIHYLIAADSDVHAVRKIAIPFQDVSVSLASWRSIQKATGCIIPRKANPSDDAVNGIMFTNKATSIMICPDGAR